jgi:hypothetical protein
MLDLAPFNAATDLQLALGPLAVAGIGLGLKALGGLFGKKGQQKKEKAAAQESQRAARDTHAQSERARVAQLQTLQNAFGGRGISLGTDPRLMEERPYVGADPTKVAGQGDTWNLFGGLFGGAGDVATGAAQAQQQQQLLSAGQPTGGGIDIEELAAAAKEAGASDDEVAQLVREMLADKR